MCTVTGNHEILSLAGKESSSAVGGKYHLHTVLITFVEEKAGKISFTYDLNDSSS